jgi:4-hydroxymandelate oxidase
MSDIEMPRITCVSDIERMARAQPERSMAWEYITGGAGDEHTLRWNEEAFQHIRLTPRVLVDVSAIDTRLHLFGRELPHPVLLAPTAYHRLLHPDGELATARGAGEAGAVLVTSSLANTSVEDVARAATGPVWFQLYTQTDRGFTRELVERAESAGCEALCVTVDTPVLGARNREARARFALPPELELPNLHGLRVLAANPSHRPRDGQIYSAVLDSTLTWKDVEWLCGFARIPVLLKGIMDPDDGAHAVDAGVDGIIVSNHGARNLDTVPATITALPSVVERVAGRVPVLVDGGIRRGTDILKALALGAAAVLVGRPYLYGLAVGGSQGVAQVVNILRTELEMAMALTARPTLASIDRSVLWESGLPVGRHAPPVTP